MTSIHAARAFRFKSMHERPRAFVIANAWDAGAARMLAGLGFDAIGTSSGASAGTLGRRDGQVNRKEALAQARAIVDSVELPVSADLEKGFADAPEDVAITIRLAAEAGLAGCSIEDASGDRDRPLFDLGLATERIAAAAEAAHALPHPFVLTARTENFLAGNPDLDDTIRRLQAYEKAGADVLFAPGLPHLDAIRTVCASLTRPVNFMVGIKGQSFTVAALEGAGVRRISLATSLYRAAMTGLLQAAREVHEHGTFSYVDRSMTTAELNGFMRR
ncbi:MAG: isocitrate lyase/phosphoenolpyruvate mutase family protein [Steroidobacteraceae bacterium]